MYKSWLGGNRITTSIPSNYISTGTIKTSKTERQGTEQFKEYRGKLVLYYLFLFLLNSIFTVNIYNLHKTTTNDNNVTNHNKVMTG